MKRGVKKHQLRQQQRGFTLIELMIVTSVFSGLLIFCYGMVINAGRTYSQVLHHNLLQETGSKIVEDIKEAIYASGGTISGPHTYVADPDDAESERWQYFCLGNRQYAYKQLGALYDDRPAGRRTPNAIEHGLKVTSINSCTAANFTNITASNSTELLHTKMWLVDFDVQPLGQTKLYQVELKLAYGGHDGDPEQANEVFVFEDEETPVGTEIIRCEPGQIFCSILWQRTKVTRKFR